MLDRLIRGAFLVIFLVFFYVLITQSGFLKFIYPQIQVTFVGLVKGILSAVIGFLVGLVLFPHKINWNDSPKLIGFGAYARVLLILSFLYIGYSYA